MARGDVGDDIEWYLLDTAPMLKVMTICGGGHAIDWAYDSSGRIRSRSRTERAVAIVASASGPI